MSGSRAALPVATVGARSWTEPGLGRFTGITTFWAASQGMWNAIYVLLAVSAVVAAPSQKELVVGKATALGGAIAVVVPIAAGWLSDRTRSRWGRRTPWILGGAAVNIAGLLLLASAHSVAALIGGYLVLQLGNNAAEAAFAGIVPDLVPFARRGRASGIMSSASAIGTVVCLLIALVALSVLGSNQRGAASGYATIAALLAVATAVALTLLREPASNLGPPPTPAGRGNQSRAQVAWGGITEAFRVTLSSHDFRWVLTTRFFQTLGIWTILPFITFYFQDVIRAANYGAASSLWLLCVLAGGILPAIACGLVSDRTGRRKAFVYASSGLQALVASVLLFTLVSNLPAIYALGILFGIGYGAFAAVDWALACDVLPDRERSAARGMGVFHVAYTLPQVIAPAIFAPVLFALNGSARHAWLGYRVVFGSAAIWFVLATVMVSRIRGVR